MSYELPIRPTPYEDESAGSFLIRIAELNGHKSVYQLLSGIGIRLNTPSLKACLIDLPRYLAIMHALGLKAEAVARPLARITQSRRASRIYKSSVLPDMAFRRDDAQAFCPSCLREAPYWRQKWQIRPLAVCLKHRRLLLDRCDECKQVTSIGRGEIARCNHCGAMLSEMSAPKANLSAAVQLHRALNGNQSSNLETILDLWAALVRFDRRDDHPSIELERLDLAVSLMQRDPSATEKIAQQVQSDVSRVHPRIQLLPFLLGDEASNSIASAVLELVSSHHEASTGGIKRPYMSKTEVCKILDLNADQLNTLIVRGKISWPVGEGRQQKIPTSAIERYLFKRDNPIVSSCENQISNDVTLKSTSSADQRSGTSMSLLHVAMQLGTSEKTVTQLVRRGLLKKAAKDHPTLHIDRASLMKLLRTLRNPDMIEEHLAAKKLGRSVSWLRTNWGKDILKIHDLVLGRYVEKAQVEMIAQVRQKYMSSATACRILRMEKISLRSMEDKGLLTALKFGKNGEYRLYERAEIRALAKAAIKTSKSPIYSVHK